MHGGCIVQLRSVLNFRGRALGSVCLGRGLQIGSLGDGGVRRGSLDFRPVVLLLDLAVRLHRDVGLGGCLRHLQLHLAHLRQLVGRHLGLYLGSLDRLHGGCIVQLRSILDFRGRALGSVRLGRGLQIGSLGDGSILRGSLNLGPVVFLLDLAVCLDRDVGLGCLRHLQLNLADLRQQVGGHLGLRLGSFHGLNGRGLVQLRSILNFSGSVLGNFGNFLKRCFRTGLGGRIAKFLELGFLLRVDGVGLLEAHGGQGERKSFQGFDFGLLQLLFGPFGSIFRRGNLKRNRGKFDHKGIRQGLGGRRFGRRLGKLRRFLELLGDLKWVQVLHLGKFGGLLTEVQGFFFHRKGVDFQVRLHDGRFPNLNDLLHQFLEAKEQGQYDVKQD